LIIAVIAVDLLENRKVFCVWSGFVVDLLSSELAIIRFSVYGHAIPY